MTFLDGLDCVFDVIIDLKIKNQSSFFDGLKD